MSAFGCCFKGPAPAPALTRVRFIKLRRADERAEHINIAAMEVLDAAGKSIKGINASLSPQYGDDLDQFGPQLLVDGYQQETQPDGSYHLPHTDAVADAWMQLDLGSEQQVSKIVIYNRTACCSDRIYGCLVELSDQKGSVVYTSDIIAGPPRAIYEFPSYKAPPSHEQLSYSGPLRYIKLRRADERAEHINIAAMEVLDAAGKSIKGIKASLFPQYEDVAQFGPQLLVDGYLKETQPYGSYHLPHTNAVADAWMQLDLGSEQRVSKIVIYNRTECCSDRINGCLVELRNEQGNVVCTSSILGGSHAVYKLTF